MTAWLAAWWHDNAVLFLAGSVLWTVCGAVVIALLRGPVQRQRVAETTVAAWLLWLGLAAAPLRDSVGTGSARDHEPVVVTVEQFLDRVAAVTDPVAPQPPAATQPTPTGSPAVVWLDVLGLCLAAGAALVLGRLAAAWLLLRHLLRRADPAPAWVTDALPAHVTQRRAVPILVSRRTWRPFCCGLLRPVIVLPHAMLEHARTAQPSALRAVLLHELAHLDRGDLRGRTLFALAAPLAFWNPVFWWLRQRAHAAAELLADEVAAAHHRDRAGYARSLIDLAEVLPAAREGRIAALGVFGSETMFSWRMTMLLRRQLPLSVRCSRLQTIVRSTAVVFMALVAAFSWSSPVVTAQEPAAQQPSARAADPATGVAAGAEAARYSITVAYESEQDIGTIVTRLAAAGWAVRSLEIAPGKDGRRTANLTLVTGQAEVRDGIAALKTLTPGHVTGVQPQSNKGAPADGPRLYFNFVDTDVAKVIDTIAKIASLNIVVDPAVKGKVTVKLQGIGWRDALDLVVKQVGARVSESDGIQRITVPAK